MNVLLTCAGRRIFPIRAFQWAVKGRGKVFACDSDAQAPAMNEADQAFTVPRIDDPEYVEDLLSICRQHGVRLLVPAMEPELPLLAEHRERFLKVGTFPLVSSAEVVDTCGDKLAAARFLKTLGIASPRTCASLEEARRAVAAGELAFPLVVKPRWGMGSLGLEVCEDDEELELSYRLVRRRLQRSLIAKVSATDAEHSVLIQERLSGIEYGFDVVNDLRGKYVCTFLRKKLRMRSGQTDRAVTVIDPGIERIPRKIGEALGHLGSLDGDLLVTREGIFVIDLNPRLGGGYPYSHMAGAGLPSALIAWVRDETPDPEWFKVRPDVSTSKVDVLVVTQDAAPMWEGQLEVQGHELSRGL
jgi:carbamoyl-phosphate synthase large subunit